MEERLNHKCVYSKHEQRLQSRTQRACYLVLRYWRRTKAKSERAVRFQCSLLFDGFYRGKKDALMMLYKRCTLCQNNLHQNKDRGITVGAVKPLVNLVTEEGIGMTEKTMVFLSSLVLINEGKEAIVEQKGIASLIETIEDESVKRKKIMILTLL